MKKSIFSILMALAFVILLASCESEKEPHVHVFSDWQYTEATYQSNGKGIRTCQCGEKIEIESKMLSDEGSINNTMKSYIDLLIEKTDGYIPSWNKESFKGKWNYIDGVFLNAIVNLYRKTNDNKYKEFFLNYIDYYINEDGKFIDPRTNEELFTTTELDSICESKILFDAYEFTNDKRYLEAIEYTNNVLLSQNKVIGSEYNYEHKKSYPNQIWLDGMYMYVPFYARYGILSEDSSVFSNITGAYKYIRQNMFNEEYKLYYHGFDSTKKIFWSDDNTGCSKSFWSRSQGWYIASLADVLEYFPDGNDKDYLISLLKEAIDGIIKYKDPLTNMLYQITNMDRDYKVLVPKAYLQSLSNKRGFDGVKYIDTEIDNYVETSSSSLIAYSIMKASRMGYINESYYEIGKKMFEGTYANSLKNNNGNIELGNICITAGLGPDNKRYRDGTHEYYLAEPVGTNDAKGVGPFILAYLEYINR